MTKPRLDLNALVVFDAVMTEQSITRAAQALAMTQPAVSNTLSRLRLRLNDELFVKHGRGVRPTEKALQIWTQVQPAIEAIEHAVFPPAFDPATAKRRFRVAASDIMVQQFWVPLKRMFDSAAPGMDLLAYPYRIAEAEKMLVNNEIELCLGVFPSLSDHLRSTYLYRSDFVCAMRKDHPLATGRLTVERFAAAEHLLITLSGDPTGHVDRALEQLGQKRRVAMTVNTFGGNAIDLIMHTNLIVVIPADMVRTPSVQQSLLILKPPVLVPPVLISMAWHTRFDRDAGHAWLRKQLLVVAEGLDKRPRVIDVDSS